MSIISVRFIVEWGSFATVAVVADRAMTRVIRNFAGRVVERAQASIKNAKGSSRPGEPPHSHTDALRDGIDYAYDELTGVLEIGPQRVDKLGDAPAVLEFGGQTVVMKRAKSGTLRPKTVTIAARPYIQPAFDAELTRLPEEWHDAIQP